VKSRWEIASWEGFNGVVWPRYVSSAVPNCPVPLVFSLVGLGKFYLSFITLLNPLFSFLFSLRKQVWPTPSPVVYHLSLFRNRALLLELRFHHIRQLRSSHGQALNSKQGSQASRTMFKLVHRSRSTRNVRGGDHPLVGAKEHGNAHGPESPVLGGEPGLVSEPPKQVQDSSSGTQNADASPSFGPSDAGVILSNPYRHRPLPTPPRKAPAMAERPSTSSGPSSRQASEKNNFRNFEKRMSKDDLYVRTASTARGAYKSYHIPIRGRLPTPDGSPRSRSPAVTVPVRTTTPDSIDGPRGVAIGMALGSPTHQAPATMANWQPQFSKGGSPSAEESGRDGREVAAKQKSGRWRLFGRFGGKKNQEPGSNRQSPEPATAPVANIIAEAKTSSESSNLDRSNTERKVPKYKPIIVRSQTEPALESPVVVVVEQPKTPRTLIRKASTRSIKKADISAPVLIPAPMPTVPTLAPAPAVPTVPIPPPPFLDVEIPSIKLERYSVMFGSVLQPQGSSSLLARRQATLDRLKTINDAIVKEEEEKEHLKPRRATSPLVTRSPAFSLFPTPPSRQNQPVVLRLSPRSRSNTSPALLPSPSKANFEAAQVRKENPKPARPNRPARPPRLVVPAAPRPHDTAVRAPSPAPEPKREQPQRAPPPQPAQSAPQPRKPSPAPQSLPPPKADGFHFGPDQSGLILDSPTDVNEREGEVIIQLDERLKPSIPEPAWQIVSPPASTPSSSASSMRKRSPSSVSSVQTHVTKPSVDIDDADTALKTAVEVSIARQISISQQQRQLLQPLQTNITRGGRREASPASSTGKSPVRRLNVGKNERLAETKSATPTLIHPKETLNSQLAQHRKSERIVVEGA
jgi:hypothetical protein